MLRVLFYTAPKWAFGAIHNGLIKRLREFNVQADVLSWSDNYTLEEFQHIQRSYDYVVTTPDSVFVVCDKSQYQVPLSKVVVIAHHSRDFYLGTERMGGIDFYDELAQVACVHQSIADIAKQIGVQRKVHVVTVGVDTPMFAGPPAQTLETIGHVGTHQFIQFDGNDCKRPELLNRVLEGMAVSYIDHPKQHYLAMPARYWDIDATVVTSSYESVGLPYLESAAAGRLVIGTPTGYFEAHHAGLGALCRMDPEGFVRDARAAIAYYRDSPRAYRERCQQVQEYCRQTFDWSKTIPTWLEVLV